MKRYDRVYRPIVSCNPEYVSVDTSYLCRTCDVFDHPRTLPCRTVQVTPSRVEYSIPSMVSHTRWVYPVHPSPVSEVKVLVYDSSLRETRHRLTLHSSSKQTVNSVLLSFLSFVCSLNPSEWGRGTVSTYSGQELRHWDGIQYTNSFGRVVGTSPETQIFSRTVLRDSFLNCCCFTTAYTTE